MSYLHFVILVAFLFAEVAKINGDYLTNGRLLTPEEGCGYAKVSTPRIVGGSEAKLGAYPWIALLGYRNGMDVAFTCSGSLITSRHVLTAAHCVKKGLYMVRLGEHDFTVKKDGKRQEIRIELAEPHEEHDDNLKLNDIAVLHLYYDVKFDDRIRPICLPLDESMQHRSFLDSMPFLAGWGKTHERGNDSTVLQHVQIPVISNEQCKEKYKAIGRFKDDSQFDDHVLCAGFTEGGKDACQGDSGGPLMLPIQTEGKFPFYQIGVVSWGVGCARPDVPGVYSSIQYYMDWIKQKTRV